MKPGIIDAVRKLRQQKLEEIREQFKGIATSLEHLVPPNLKAWFAEDGQNLLDGLLEHGQISLNYYPSYGDPTPHGYTNIQEFARRFTDLATCWRGVVDVRASLDRDSRLKVLFKAVVDH